MAKNRWSLVMAVFVIAAGSYRCSDDDDDQSSSNGQAGAPALQCPEGSVQYTSSSGEGFCCPGDQSTFCDVNADGYTSGCWPEETDCETITECGDQWASCPSGALPVCINDQLQCLSCSDESFVQYSASGTPFCCDDQHPVFCDETDQDYSGGCWEAGIDCQTIAQCNGNWTGCTSGLVVVCDAATGQSYCTQN